MDAETLKAVQEERAHCLNLIEAPIPGLRALIPTLKEPRLAYVQINTLEEAAKSVRESGAFRDAMEARRSIEKT